MIRVGMKLSKRRFEEEEEKTTNVERTKEKINESNDDLIIFPSNTMPSRQTD